MKQERRAHLDAPFLFEALLLDRSSRGGELYLVRHVQILLSDAASIVSRQHAVDLRVPDIDVGMMLRRFGRLRHPRYERDPVRKGFELERFG
jgi:hypothetical protein